MILARLIDIHCRDGTSMSREFAEKCYRCGAEIIFIREGVFSSDITECECAIIEHANSMELMGNVLTFGDSKIIKDKQKNDFKERKQ